MSRFEKLGISDRVERFSGIVPDSGPGRLGCILSHVTIIRQAKTLGLKNVLVFEDDIEFLDVNSIVPAVSQLRQREWALYYLGYTSFVPLKKASPNLLAIQKCYSTHAIAYDSSIFDVILTAFDQGQIDIIDVWLSERIQPTFNCFGNYPIAVVQSPGYSDIEKRHVKYNTVERFIKNTRHLKNKYN